MTRSGIMALIVALVLVTPAVSLSQNNPGRSGVAVANGRCVSVSVGGERQKGCKSEIASVTLADGTIQFIFTVHGKVISFGGDGHAVHGSPPNSAVLRDCQEFRVRACIMGTKEITHGTTERAYYPG